MSTRLERTALITIIAIAVGISILLLGNTIRIPVNTGFEVTGEFRSLETNGNTPETMTITIAVAKREAERLETKYPRSVGAYEVPSTGELPDKPGYVAFSRDIKGRWCGELPQPRTEVRVLSSGYISTTIIIDGSKTYHSTRCNTPTIPQTAP